MLQGLKAIHEHVCSYTGRQYSLDTVRRWKWLSPAMEELNGRVAARADRINELLAARVRPRSS